MAIIHMRVKHDGQKWYVNLPTYRMIDGTFRPVIKGLTDKHGVLPNTDPNEPRLANLGVDVEVPDDCFHDDKRVLDVKKIRHKYRGQPRWDRDDYNPEDDRMTRVPL